MFVAYSLCLFLLLWSAFICEINLYIYIYIYIFYWRASLLFIPAYMHSGGDRIHTNAQAAAVIASREKVNTGPQVCNPSHTCYHHWQSECRRSSTDRTEAASSHQWPDDGWPTQPTQSTAEGGPSGRVPARTRPQRPGAVWRGDGQVWLRGTGTRSSASADRGAKQGLEPTKY